MNVPRMNSIGLARSILLSLALGTVTSAVAATRYIAVGGNNSNSGTISSPWKTMAWAMDALNNPNVVGPGDTVIVKNGTYNERFNISRSGSSASILTIKAENPLGAEVDLNYGEAYGFFITGSYVKIDGFKVKEANMSGITANATHHITITNCESFDNKGAGIYGGKSDYLTIDRNHVYKNAWGAGIVTSGISIHLPENITGSTDTTTQRIKIRWNNVHENYQVSNNPTDGAGIILDDLMCRQSDTLPDYTFPALVEGNLCWENGGVGIKLFSSRNLTVRNNTCFKNSRLYQSTWSTEIQIINCDDVDVVNNIVAHDSLNRAFGNLVQTDGTNTGDNLNIVWRNNLQYNYDGASANKTNFTGATVPTSGSPNFNKIDQTPGFIDATAPGYNLRLNPGSNSRNAGTSALGFATTDLDGLTRPQGTAIDIGCFEYQE